MATDGLKVQLVPGARALRLEGYLDMSTAPLLEEQLRTALEGGGPLVLDMSAVTFMDSTGIHECIRAAMALAEQGWCVYLHVDDGMVERALSLVDIEKIPNVHVVDHLGAKTPAQ